MIEFDAPLAFSLPKELEEPSFDFELRGLAELGAPKVDALMFLTHYYNSWSLPVVDQINDLEM
jgi:hypothetical protein